MVATDTSRGCPYLICQPIADPVHDPEKHNPEWTPSRMDTISNGHHLKWTPSQMDTIQMETIPNGHHLE